MQDDKNMLDLEFHKKMAKDCFNGTWDLIDKTNRTAEELRTMIHMAHTSVYHWHLFGEPIHQARGEWQVSRVYSIAGMAESALYHGKSSLQICLDNNIGDFDLAFGYEAVARAFKILENREACEKYINLAKDAAKNIESNDDKEYFINELSTV